MAIRQEDKKQEVEEFKTPLPKIIYEVSEESLSELSDEGWYIMNGDEIELKSILWNEMNPEYDEIEEKRAKESLIKEKKIKWPWPAKESFTTLEESMKTNKITAEKID